MAAERHANVLLEAALGYAARGWAIFPLQPNTKVPFAGTRGFHDATTDPEQITAWWRRWPRANVGLATGQISGLVGLDEDTYKGADAGVWRLPVTLQVRTARGGLHWLYAYDQPLASVPEGKLAPGICLKADGGYLVAPPSLYNGQPYAWVDAAQPIIALPRRILELVEQMRAPRALRPLAEPAGTGTSGADYWIGKAVTRAQREGRNVAGLWLAQQLLWNECADVGGAMLVYQRQVEHWEEPAYTEREALASLRQAGQHPRREPARGMGPAPAPIRSERPQPPTDGTSALKARHDDPPPTDDSPDEALHYTDMGNARRFVRQHGASVRHVGVWGHWMTWDGRRWQHDYTSEAMRLAKATVRTLYREVADAEEGDRSALAKWAIKSEARERLTAMLAVAQSEPELACLPDAFDMHPWLLSVQNGTIDLRTGDLLPHAREHHITRLAPVVYDPGARCPLWLAFLDRIMGGKAQLIAFLQRAVGYSLTDLTSAQVLFLLHGNGANGKSKFLEAIEGVLGDYGMSTPTSTLMAKRDNNIPNDVARLKGARFVKAIETEEGHALAESLVKQMTGGDMISARFMRGEWFDFKPTFKLWLAANHLPTIRGTDDGIWRRIRYIPFDVQIPEADKDEELGEKLKAEYPGILAWAVQGCLDWQREGLGYPDEVRAATKSYRDSMNHFGRFLEERCILEPMAEVSAKVLRQAYEQWCTDNGERVKSQMWVGKELQALKIARTRDSGGATLYAGLRLASQLA